MRKLTANLAPDSIAHVTLAEALALLATPDGKRSAAVFEHRTLQVKLYAPRGADAQTSHTRDEIYVVGRATVGSLTASAGFAPHDVIFAKADDVSVWVFFYGPEGGKFDTATVLRGG
jgi:hypothetical protein